MIRFTLFFILIILTVTADSVYAQVVLRIDPNLKKPTTELMSAEKEAEVIQTTTNILNDYAQRLSMRDPDSKIVTTEMISNFRELFIPSATLPADFKEEVRGDLTIRDYCDEVFLKLKLDGIQVVLNDFLLNEISYDPDGFYKVFVDITKTRYNYIDTNGKVIKSASGKRMKQRMVIDIRIASAQKGLIRSLAQIIEGKADRPSEQDIQTLGLSVGIGSGILAYSESPLYATALPGSQLDISNGLNFSIGFDYTTTKIVNAVKSPDKDLQLLLGLRYSIEQVKTDMSSFALAPFQATASENGTSQDYLRMVGPIDGKEELSLGVLEPYLGIGYRLMNKRQAMLYLSVKAIPRVLLSSSGDFNGRGIYDGIILMQNGQPSEFRFLREDAIKQELLQNPLGAGPYQVGGDLPLIYDFESDYKGGVAFEFSPRLYLDLTDDNPTWGLMIGFDLSFHPTYLKNGGDGSVHGLLYPESLPDRSLLEYYATDVSALTYGFRIGFYRKSVKSR